MDGYSAINNMFVSEAPSGDADVEDEVWDEARLRALEGRRQGRAPGCAHVRPHRRRRGGGDDEAFVNETMPHRGFQGGTLVVTAHRGHRLGLAVKIANQRALAGRFPELSRG